MRISLWCDALANVFDVADSRTQIVGTDIFRSLAHLATTMPNYYDLFFSELIKHGELSFWGSIYLLRGAITDVFNVDDSRAQVLNTDIVTSLDRMLKSSNENALGSCIHLLSELVEYGVFSSECDAYADLFCSDDLRAHVFETSFMQSFTRIFSKRTSEPYSKLILRLAAHGVSLFCAILQLTFSYRGLPNATPQGRFHFLTY